MLDAAFDAAMLRSPDGAARSAGIAAGEKAAMTVVDQRKNDGPTDPTPIALQPPRVYWPTATLVLTFVDTSNPWL